MTYSKGDKVRYCGGGAEYSVEGVLHANPGGDACQPITLYRLKNSPPIYAHESDLSPAAPPKLGKVRVVLRKRDSREGTFASAYSENETEFGFTFSTPACFDRILDLDALDADKRRAAAAEREAAGLREKVENLEIDIMGYRTAMHYLDEDLKRERAELARLRAAPGDLVPIDDLADRGVTIQKCAGAWHVYKYDGSPLSRLMLFQPFSTHLAAHQAASAWARKEAAR